MQKVGCGKSAAEESKDFLVPFSTEKQKCAKRRGSLDEELIAARHGIEPHLVLEAGHAEVEQVQQAVELRHRQVVEPLLQHQLVCVLQHPQQTDEKAAAGLGQEAAVLSSRLDGRWRAGVSKGGGGNQTNSIFND